MARWTVRFFAEAADELDEAEKWYRVRDARAAEKWRIKARDTIHSIAHHPELWAVDSSGIREVRIGDYKYKVVYRLLSTTVEIVAIAHTSRRPGYWRQRLRKQR